MVVEYDPVTMRQVQTFQLDSVVADITADKRHQIWVRCNDHTIRCLKDDAVGFVIEFTIENVVDVSERINIAVSWQGDKFFVESENKVFMFERTCSGWTASSLYTYYCNQIRTDSQTESIS